MSTKAVGDILRRPIAFGPFKHLGIVVGFNTVLTNTPQKGEPFCPVDEFGQGQNVEVKSTGANAQAVATRANQVTATPKDYDLLQRNCEQTVYEVACGKARSPQLWIGLGIFFLVLWWFFGRD